MVVECPVPSRGGAAIDAKAAVAADPFLSVEPACLSFADGSAGRRQEVSFANLFATNVAVTVKIRKLEWLSCSVGHAVLSPGQQSNASVVLLEACKIEDAEHVKTQILSAATASTSFPRDLVWSGRPDDGFCDQRLCCRKHEYGSSEQPRPFNAFGEKSPKGLGDKAVGLVSSRARSTCSEKNRRWVQEKSPVRASSESSHSCPRRPWRNDRKAMPRRTCQQCASWRTCSKSPRSELSKWTCPKKPGSTRLLTPRRRAPGRML